MSTAEHTPGPWKLCFDGQIDGADGKTLLSFNWNSYKEFNDQPEVEKANARLIAAAPDLLTALAEMVARIEYYTSMGSACQVNIEQWEYTNGSSDMERARAAIAKATGAA